MKYITTIISCDMLIKRLMLFDYNGSNESKIKNFAGSKSLCQIQYTSTRCFSKQFHICLFLGLDGLSQRSDASSARKKSTRKPGRSPRYDIGLKIDRYCEFSSN